MANLHQSLLSPLPGLDLLQSSSGPILRKSFSMLDFMAKTNNQAFALISLKPARLLYTCESFCQHCGVQVVEGKPLPIQYWLNCLDTCSGMPLSTPVGTFLEELSSLSHLYTIDGPMLVFDFCLAKNGMNQKRIQHQIKPISLQQKSPDVLFLCSVQVIEHIAPSYNCTLKLMQGEVLLKKEVFSLPLLQHPMLKDLSSTERKVLTLIHQQGSSKDVHTKLNMALDTLKSHKSHIMIKTGMHTIDALIAVLKREMGK
jgi:DNA-binding CsgD family transcriptional regulator